MILNGESSMIWARASKKPQTPKGLEWVLNWDSPTLLPYQQQKISTEFSEGDTRMN